MEGKGRIAERRGVERGGGGRREERRGEGESETMIMVIIVLKWRLSHRQA